MAQPLQHQHHKPTPAHKPAAAVPQHAAAVETARKLGRKPRAFSPLVPHFSVARLRAPATAIPPTIDWLKGMPADLGFMLNGGTNDLVPGGQALGDCPFAGLAHGRQVWTFNTTGKMVTDPDKDVLADYETLGGYVLGDPSTDQGGVLQDVLAGAMRIGLTTETGPDKIVGYYEVDPRNLDDVRRVIAECGFAYIGISIPEAWSEANAGDTWDATESPVEGGHCVILTGYDSAAATFSVISWGMRFSLTEAGFRQACDEAYGVVDQCWAQLTGRTPAGLTLAQIEADMAAIRAS